jgi:ribosomal-protein-alanine N-acetyltransferase
MKTLNLELVQKTRNDVQAMIDAMNPYEKAQLSADWLARFRASTISDPWIHGFSAKHRQSGAIVGTGMFKAPPVDGIVEIAYGIAVDHRGNGYATEIAGALVIYAFSFDEIKVVRAHTLPDSSASQRILGKCGFEHVGEFNDPEDGLVWRFEMRRGTGEISPEADITAAA